MSRFHPQNFEIILKKIYVKSERDFDFRTLCLSDSKAAYKQISGVDSPTHVEYKFVENPQDQAFALPEFQPMEMTEEALDEVAGDSLMQRFYILATTDKFFRELALNDANEAMKKLTGKGFPSGTAINFVESKDEQAFLLPPFIESKKKDTGDQKK